MKCRHNTRPAQGEDSRSPGSAPPAVAPRAKARHKHRQTISSLSNADFTWSAKRQSRDSSASSDSAPSSPRTLSKLGRKHAILPVLPPKPGAVDAPPKPFPRAQGVRDQASVKSGGTAVPPSLHRTPPSPTHTRRHTAPSVVPRRSADKAVKELHSFRRCHRRPEGRRRVSPGRNRRNFRCDPCARPNTRFTPAIQRSVRRD